MRGRTLRPPAGTRPTHRQLLGRCRRLAVGLTHSPTVKMPTDNHDLPPHPAQHVAAARAPGVRNQLAGARCSPTPSAHTASTPCAASASTSLSSWSSSTAKLTTHTRSSPIPPHSRFPFSPNASKGRTAHEVRPNSPAPVSAHACADTSGRRLTSWSLRWRTLVDHQAIHRRTSPTTPTAGLHPATQRMGSPRTEVRGLRPRIRSTPGAPRHDSTPANEAASHARKRGHAHETHSVPTVTGPCSKCDRSRAVFQKLRQ